MLIKLSAQHLSENNMTYWQHLVFALRHALICLISGVLLIFHAIIPAVFPQTGSKLTTIMNKSFTSGQNNEYAKLKKTLDKINL